MARALAILTLAAVPLMAQSSVGAGTKAAPTQQSTTDQGPNSRVKAPWRDVTPRAGLAGWRATGGKASYAFENGEVIGRAEPGKTNSWLVSEAQYGDFIIEFDAKTDPALNSGMMIRGQSRPDYRDGVVYGYQAEIDPSSRRWSAGLYDEQRRQWLYTLGRNEAARQTFRSGDWNHYRVEAIGTRLRTWINGVPAADVVDDVDARGFIAFQVHAIPDAEAARHPEVRFRNVRMITDSPARFAMPATALPQQGWLTNRLSAGEQRAGWKMLWDGKTGAGWRSVKSQKFPASGWSMADGALRVDGGGGDIATIRDYRNFELSIDFKLTPGANSGIKYFVDAGLLKKGESIGLEYQLLDDERHPDAKMGRDGNRTLGSLYDLIAAKNLSDPDSPGKRINPPGSWNRAVIVARGTHVEHWLNGFKMVEYDRGSPAFRALVAQSKYAGVPGFGEGKQGPILLQDHGDRVEFRSIKLREL
ncbi:3-keto-disaccharide hydrolase [Sphingomonas faeni]|uniref:3-keto-disaccharide hydrolase n=1 Tax=Sphingomonas faeni TaxID=185950 RepID=UPI00334E3068